MSASGCESIRPLVSAFMDGELSPEESRRLREHLDSCPACRELFDDYRLVRDQMRQLPPDPQPPEDIAQVVWEHARRQQSRGGLAHWIGVSGARLSLSVAAALAILVIASAFLLVRGYQQGVPPGVAGSQPALTSVGQLQTWPMTQPVRITFNKPMDHKSVQDYLKILPATAYNQQLPTSWDGNTLIIGASSSNARNLMSDTDYTIAILPQATDIYGHPLGGNGFELKFRTTSSVAASTGTSTPAASATSARTAPTSTPSKTPQQVAAAPSQTVPPSGGPGGGTGQADATSSSQSTGTASSSVTPGQNGTSETQTTTSGTVPMNGPAATATATAPSQPTPTPSPTAQSTPSPTPTSTQTPAPTATASATEIANAATPTGTASPESATPTSTPTPTPVPVTGAFGSVYWANQSVQDKLGAPDPRGQYTTIAEELPFQTGLMYDSRDQSSTIYVLTNSDNSYEAYQDTWQKSDSDPTSPTPPSSNPPLYLPVGNFGKVWQEQNLSSTIGFAVSDPTKVSPESVPIQQFAHGLMLYDNQGFIYVLYNSDDTWEVYPDTSGHGDLLPTPTPSSSATATPTTTPAGTPPTATPTGTSGSGIDAVSTSTATPTVTPTP